MHSDCSKLKHFPPLKAQYPSLVGWLFFRTLELIICHPPHPGVPGTAGAVQQLLLSAADLPQDVCCGAGSRHPGAGNPPRADEARGALRPAG